MRCASPCCYVNDVCANCLAKKPGPKGPIKHKGGRGQRSFYFDEQNDNELPKQSAVVVEDLRGMAKLRWLAAYAKDIAIRAAAAMALTLAYSAEAIETTHPETHHESHQAPQERLSESPSLALPAGLGLPVVGADEVGVRTAPAQSHLPTEASVGVSGLPEAEPECTRDDAACALDMGGAVGGMRLGEVRGVGDHPDVGERAPADDTPRELGRPIPPKPRFPARAYEDGRGKRISEAREALYHEFYDDLADIDRGALSFGHLCDDDSWALYYKSHLDSRREKLKERAEREAAKEKRRQELAKPTLAKMVYPIADPLIREQCSLEFFEKEFEAVPRPKSLDEFERWESKLIDRIEEALLERAKFEGGQCKSRSSLSPEASVVYGAFNQTAAAAQVKRVERTLNEYRLERKKFRRQRAAQFAIQEEQLQVVPLAQLPGVIIEQPPPEKLKRNDHLWRKILPPKKGGAS